MVRPVKRLAVSAVFVLGLAAAPSASAAQDIFMRVTGVHGESQDSRYPLSSQIDDFSFTIKTEPPATKATFDTFKVSKPVDSTSPFMFNHVGTQAHISSIRIAVRKAGTSAPKAYLQYCLENALIQSDSVSGSEDGVTEKIQIRPQSVEMRYVAQKSDGSAATPVLTGWDIVSNTSIGFNNTCAGIAN